MTPNTFSPETWKRTVAALLAENEAQTKHILELEDVEKAFLMSLEDALAQAFVDMPERERGDRLEAMVDRMAGTNVDLMADNARLREENKALVDGLLTLTPGGSEFVNTPGRCLEFVKDRMANVMKVAAENKRLSALAATQPEEGR